MKKNDFISVMIIMVFCLFSFFSCQQHNTDYIYISTDTIPLGYSYQNKADYFSEQQLNDSAYFYYLKSNKALITINDSANISYNFLKISEIQLFVGDAIGAEQSSIEALKHVPHEDISYLTTIYNNIGRCYRKLYNYEKAIEYYNKALQYESDELRKRIIKNNIAYTYLYSGDLQRASQMFDSLVQSPVLKQNPIHYARSLDNLGISQFKIDANKGLPHLQRALHIRDSLNYEHGLVESYSNLCQYYVDKNQPIAKNHALKMYQLAQKLKNPNDELDALSLLLQTSPANELRSWSEKYITLSNNITKTTQTAKNQFAKIKYDHQKETAENLLLKTKTTEQELDIQRETNRRQILLFSLVALIVGVVLFIKNIRRRHKVEKAKQVYLTETKISKKIHDELANDIYNIVAFSENFDLGAENHKNRLLNELENAYNKSRNISSDYGTISFGDDFLNDLKSLLQEYNGKSLKIVSVGIDTIEWNSLTEVKKIAIYRVIQELLVNMKKHSQASLVSLKFERVKGQLKISYYDNGIGIVNEKLITKNGLAHAENRIKDIQGSFTFETEINKGLKIHITIPL